MSRQELIDAIWQQSFVDDNAINRAISELRKVLQHPSLQQSPIKTHHRKGYSLQLSNIAVSGTDTAAQSNDKQQINDRQQSTTKPKKTIIIFIFGFIILLIVIASYFFLTKDSAATPIAAKAATDKAKPVIQKLNITTNQKVTWFKGVESRPLLSPNKQLLAYTHTLPDGSMRSMVRKASLAVTTQALQEITIASADSHFVVHSWQPMSQRLLVQKVTKDGKDCQYLVYDFGQFPDFLINNLAQCTGFTLGNAQISADGQWLYRSSSVSGVAGSSALVAENLNTSETQVLVAAPTTGLGATMLGLSADGSKLAYIFMPESSKPEVFIYTLATREHQRLLATPFPTFLMGLDWSPDQSKLYLPAFDSLLQIDIASKNLTILALPENVAVGELTLLSETQAYTSSLSATNISKDGMQLIKVSHPFDNELRQFTVLNNTEGSAVGPAFSATTNNRYFFSANWSGNWQLWLHDNGKDKQLTEWADSTQPIKDTSWSSDGRYIAFSKDGNLYLYDFQRQQLITKFEHNDMGQPVWLPDNSGIVFTRVVEERQNLWQLDLISNELNQLTFGGASQALYNDSGQLLYHRDGKLISYIDGRRADTEILAADAGENFIGMSQLHNNEQWRYGLLGHLQRRALTGEVLQQTQLPYQIISMSFNP